jgi:hypothetical protein
MLVPPNIRFLSSERETCLIQPFASGLPSFSALVPMTSLARPYCLIIGRQRQLGSVILGPVPDVARLARPSQCDGHEPSRAALRGFLVEPKQYE